MQRARIILAFALLALAACGPPAGDPSHEILEASKGRIGVMVKLKSTPSLKNGSLSDAAQVWQSLGWQKIAAEVCKGEAKQGEQMMEAYERVVDGYAPEKIPTCIVRICVSQLSHSKRIAALGYVLSARVAQPPKP